MSPVLTESRAGLEPGQIVDGRYRVERFLGEGWSGSSYLVAPIETHPSAGGAAAGSQDAAPFSSARAVLKLLRPSRKIDLQTLKRCGLFAVQHPNLVAPAGSGTDPHGGLQYVVWPWIGGIDWVSAARLGGPRELPFLLAPVCRGLAHLHERGAWHGRLHAGNCRVFQGGEGANRRIVLHDYALRGIDRHDLPAHDLRDLAWMIVRGLLDEPCLSERNQLPAPDLTCLLRAAVEPLSLPLAYVVRRCLGDTGEKPFASALEVLDELNRRAGLDLAIDPPELRRPLILDGRLVGRQRQMEALKRRLEALTGGSLGVPEAPIAVLIGESGVGKSRILREFAAHARKKKVWLASGACREGGGQAYAALDEALNGIADELERLREKQGEPAAGIHPLLLKYGSELVKVSAELRRKLGVGPSRALEPEPEKMRLIDQITYFINDASRNAPIVIVLEDIHWADEGTFDFLRYLCRVARGGSVQVLMTARREEVADSLLKPFLDQGGGEGWLQQIEVEPLTLKEMAQIARQAMQARESTDQAALERICREGEGNPYQLQEILCHLVERGVLRRQAEGWVLDQSRLDSVPIPKQVAEAFLDRVGRLDRQSRQVLQLLAACARPATVEQLGRMLDQPRWEIQRCVEALSDRAILERIAHPQGTLYGFRHARQRAALYERIEKGVKSGLHARVARELESSRKEHDIDRQAELTRHLVAAGKIREAFEAGILAIQALLRGNALRDGKALASHLGEHLDLAPPELRARLLNLFADCLVLQAAPEEAIGRYEEALAMARSCGREADVAASLAGIVRACFWSRNHDDREKGLSAAREAYRIGCRQQDASLVALLLTRWAGFYLEADRLHIAERMLKRARRLIEENRLDSLLPAVTINLGLVAAFQNQFRTARSCLCSARTCARKINDVTSTAMALSNLLYVENEAGDYKLGKSILASQEVIDLCRPGKIVYHTVRGEEARNLLGRGDPIGALKILSVLYEPSEEFSRSVGVSTTGVDLIDTLIILGRIDEAERILTEAKDRGAARFASHVEFRLHLFEGQLRAAQGRGAEAEKIFNETLETARARRNRREEAAVLEQLIRLRARKQKHPQLERDVSRLGELAADGEAVSETIAAACAGAILARERGEDGKAMELLQSALEVAERHDSGLRSMMILGQQCALGRRSGRRNDVARAQKVLDERIERILQEMESETDRKLFLRTEIGSSYSRARGREDRSAARVAPGSARMEELLEALLKARRSGSGVRGFLSAIRLPPVAVGLLVEGEMSCERLDERSGNGVMQEIYRRMASVVASRLESKTDGTQIQQVDLVRHQTAARGDLFILTALEGRRGAALAYLFEGRPGEEIVRYARATARIVAHLADARPAGGEGAGRPGEQARDQRDSPIIGGSGSVEQLLRQIKVAARGDVGVLIQGESGTGKELVARRIHALSRRSSQRFLAVDCGAIPDNLIESELFGYRRGAFTGAERDRPGMFEEVEGGTLLLDEIGNAGANFQAKLLRVLQEREVRRIGENRPRPVNVRILAATNIDLKAEIDRGRFREDLFYRLSVMTIEVPPLRQRKDDIAALARAFLGRMVSRGQKASSLSQAALMALRAHEWPGNVRELQNVLQAAALAADGGTILPAHLPEELQAARIPIIQQPPEPMPPGEDAAASEKRDLEEALRRTGGDKTAACEILGWNRMKIYRRLKQYQIPLDFGRSPGRRP